MRQRAMIAMALLAKPALLLADEPTTALDVTIQAEIIDIFADLARADGSGTGLILVTHDLGVVAHLCRRIAIMYAGRIVETGPVHAIFDAPRHPYTQALLAAMPRLDGDPDQPLTAIDGQPPGPGDIVAGCAFAPRCPNRMAACTQRVPMLTAVAAGHDVACLLVEAPVP
jgi:oligopeptide/dipeptide ABC transporter ATP-binding protein